ncbi:MAG: hypothetical protein FWE82_07235, partial [Defluviitaleaceae bacterium]|nr:hypothetical protein [Defluviitaleaceae bacterium]
MQFNNDKWPPQLDADYFNGLDAKIDGLDTKIDGLAGRIGGVNLLHNWDFRNPVNQRGLAEYASEGYTVDRWRISGKGKIVIANDGVIFTNTETAANMVEFLQFLEF